MTNHHVGADALQKMSTPEQDLVAKGFYAENAGRRNEVRRSGIERAGEHRRRDQARERGREARHECGRCPEARGVAIINTIEKESIEKTGLRSDVVTLYQGGQYHLYRFKKYTDVRLVFAPEKDIAFFGGDPDNFEFPRYDLDICLFRVYENGKPAKVEHYLQWSRPAQADDELVFVAGHPGSTDRLNTVQHLEFPRQQCIPQPLRTICRREVLLKLYSRSQLENARRKRRTSCSAYQNSRKARLGGLAGLQDPALMDQEAKREAKRHSKSSGRKIPS